jgi:hypothetical protein
MHVVEHTHSPLRAEGKRKEEEGDRATTIPFRAISLIT